MLADLDVLLAGNHCRMAHVSLAGAAAAAALYARKLPSSHVLQIYPIVL